MCVRHRFLVIESQFVSQPVAEAPSRTVTKQTETNQLSGQKARNTNTLTNRQRSASTPIVGLVNNSILQLHRCVNLKTTVTR